MTKRIYAAEMSDFGLGTKSWCVAASLVSTAFCGQLEWDALGDHARRHEPKASDLCRGNSNVAKRARYAGNTLSE